MVTKLLTQEFVFAALEAERNGEKFPISLDDVWGVLGYSNKGNAKARLVKDLVENEDFAFLRSHKWSQQGRSGDSIGVSTDGYKHFCLMARTKKGREIRKYFIGIEKEYRANLERQLQASLQPSTQDTSKELRELQEKHDQLKQQLQASLQTSAPDTSKELRELQEKHDYLEQQLKVIDKIVDQMNNDLARVVDNTYEVITMNALAKDPCQKLVLNYSLYIATHPILRQMKEMFYI